MNTQKGWKLVPVEPTPEMLAATSWPKCAETDYRHMLDAAPTPPVATENTSAGRVAETAEREHIALRLPEPMTDKEVAALIDETEYLPTDHAVRYLVETGECRVKEANEYPFHRDDIRTLLDRLKDLESNGSQAVRWAPSSAHWSSELRRLFGADARDGIDALEQRLRDAEAENERLRDALEAVVAYRTGGLIERLCREALEDTDAR